MTYDNHKKKSEDGFNIEKEENALEKQSLLPPIGCVLKLLVLINSCDSHILHLWNIGDLAHSATIR